MFGTLLIIIITYMKADILKPSRQTILREAKDYVMIAVGMILYGIGWTVFLLPNDITTGGVPGIASIVYWATGFPVQYTYFGINFFLLLLALKLLGLKFCIKTIFGVFTLTFFLSVIQQLASGVSLLRDQPFMACVIGASFCGGGIGVAFCANGSTGGTDVIAAIINKYRHNLGKSHTDLRYDHHYLQLFRSEGLGEGGIRICNTLHLQFRPRSGSKQRTSVCPVFYHIQ